MVYEIFLENIRLAVAGQLGSSFSVSLRQIPKNNGVLSDSLCIQKPPSTVAAAIYLRQFFEEYENGLPVSCIVSEILNLYTGHSLPATLHPEQFLRFSSARTSLACKLINTADNELLLSQVPHIPFLDLSIVFFLFLENDEEAFTSIINMEQLSQWNMTETELFTEAHANSPRLFPPILQELGDAIEGMIQNGSAGDEEEPASAVPDFCNDPQPLHVLSNTKGMNGAYCMLYPGVLKEFADSYGSDLIILPSSVHEVILVPDTSDSRYDEMNEMVKEINCSDVSEEDRLSSHIYLYSRLSDRIFLPSGISSKIP